MMNFLNTARRRTREVRIGSLRIGADHPVAVQSMTTTDTTDVDATVAQAIRLVEAGCQLVRITAPTIDDARALGAIKEKLRAAGIGVPLCADIHFHPGAAMEAVKHVEKVRVNPGNFADSKAFRVKEYDDATYAAEVKRVQERFRPLVKEAKARGVALRIGTNHGSLSDRIMNRWGDSPAGMVESAMEFVHVCEEEGHRDVVFSMKASNPKVMIQAYRMLAARLASEGLDHPFHLGVTEAGEGEDGRVKSAIGIGSLLMDGIGDTIRVSLTEDPVREIPVARRLVSLCAASVAATPPGGRASDQRPAEAGTTNEGRRSLVVPPSGGRGSRGDESDERPAEAGTTNEGRRSLVAPPSGGRGSRGDASDERPAEAGTANAGFDPVSYARRVTTPSGFGVHRIGGDAPVLAMIALDEATARRAGTADTLRRLAMPRAPGSPALEGVLLPASCADVAPSLRAAVPGLAVVVDAAGDAVRSESAGGATCVSLRGGDVVSYRRVAAASQSPVILHVDLPADPQDALLYGAAVAGSLLCDGIGDAVRFAGPHAPERLLEMVLNVLQACRLRASRTEYIACPGCGRTLFDLETTTQRIKARTGHLPGVKIAVMGCIVNGPGEMADADFGYVGSSPGLVNLYVGKDIVERGVPQAEADDRLVALMKSRGAWRERADTERDPASA